MFKNLFSNPMLKLLLAGSLVMFCFGIVYLVTKDQDPGPEDGEMLTNIKNMSKEQSGRTGMILVIFGSILTMLFGMLLF